jgi:hypothetical protein
MTLIYKKNLKSKISCQTPFKSYGRIICKFVEFCCSDICKRPHCRMACLKRDFFFFSETKAIGKRKNAINMITRIDMSNKATHCFINVIFSEDEYDRYD